MFSTNGVHQVRLSVQVQRPASDDLALYDRDTRVKKLQENARQRQQDILDWLDEHDLADQVSCFAPSTVFNLLFMDASPEVADRIKDAPGVVEVAIVEEVEVDLMHEKDEETRPMPYADRD
jgi:hypothetical protein